MQTVAESINERSVRSVDVSKTRRLIAEELGNAVEVALANGEVSYAMQVHKVLLNILGVGGHLLKDELEVGVSIVRNKVHQVWNSGESEQAGEWFQALEYIKSRPTRRER